jgi:hypothetical protein
MNRFVFKVPRTAVAVAAIAMSVLTLSVSIAPALLEAGAPQSYAAARESDAIEVAIIPARIEVIGHREPQTLFGAVKQLLTRKGQPT